MLVLAVRTESTFAAYNSVFMREHACARCRQFGTDTLQHAHRGSAN
jgi:hypothetical protein